MRKKGEFLAGYKSYIIGMSMVLMGLAVMGLRKGIAKAEK